MKQTDLVTKRDVRQVMIVMLLRRHLGERGNVADFTTQEVSPTMTPTSVDFFLENQSLATFTVNSGAMPSLRTPQSPKNGRPGCPVSASPRAPPKVLGRPQ